MKQRELGNRTITFERVREDDGSITYVIADEGGEFARASSVALAIPYLLDLLDCPTMPVVVNNLIVQR